MKSKLSRLFLTACIIFHLIKPLPSPNHCYDFISTVVNDSCGGADLTRMSRFALVTQVVELIATQYVMIQAANLILLHITRLSFLREWAQITQSRFGFDKFF